MSAPTPVPGAEQLAELERLAVELAIEAARLVHDERPRELGALGARTKSSSTDVVTVMDTRAEALLHAGVLERRPLDGLLGEEGSSVEGSSGITWVVDPIDGTTNYLYDHPSYAVSVAAAVGAPPAPGWRPVAGAVCAPGLGLVWSARLGGGARRRDLRSGSETPISVGGLDRLDHALVGTGFGYAAQTRAEQALVLTRVLPAVRDIRRIGSAAIDLCLTADGRLDAYFERGLNPWDLAAGWLVLTEAGGVVCGPAGGDPDARLTVAGNPALVEALLPLVDG
ncbi:MAG TPA: inositol monophosphatase family protein [Dermatophilaceae bacterium]|nr:inositol monophosphatase family protein [Dermatophilaceae bacterium]